MAQNDADDDMSKARIPKEAKDVEAPLRKKIEERTKQAADLKIYGKAKLIAEQLGEVHVESKTWRLRSKIFSRGDIWVKFYISDITIKWKDELVHQQDRGLVECFKPMPAWLKALDKWHEAAIKNREDELKKRFGLNDCG